MVVTGPDGATRAVSFSGGEPVGADTSEADPGGLEASREQDLNLLGIGPERYEIPDAVTVGG